MQRDRTVMTSLAAMFILPATAAASAAPVAIRWDAPSGCPSEGEVALLQRTGSTRMLTALDRRRSTPTLK